MRRRSNKMLEQTLQSAELGASREGAEGISPFEDLAAVHALYEKRVFNFLLLSLRDRDVALSLTQDTFLQAWRTRARFRGDCSVISWLMRIALNLVRSHTRTEVFRFWKRAAKSAVDAAEMQWALAHPASSAEQRLAAQQQLAQVWDTVERLSKNQRTVFLLRFVDEMELLEIAAATGMPLPTVKTHLYRALDIVRAALTQGAERSGK
jgi:RNA polymerase sigma-70 factor, ECF subfamily